MSTHNIGFHEEVVKTIFQLSSNTHFICSSRVATVREKCLENEIFSRSGKSQGISILVREI